MAPRELFTLAMTSEVRLWSMTKGERKRLARVVLVYLEVTEGEAGDQFSLRVLDADRNFDEVHVQDESRERSHAFSGRGHLRRSGLDLVLALGGGRLVAGRGLLLVRSGGGRTGCGRLIRHTLAGRNRGAVHARQRRGRLGRRSIGHGGWLLLGQSRKASSHCRRHI